MVVDQFARADQVRGVLAVQDHDQSDDAGPFAIAHAVKVLENSQAPELVRNFKKLGLEDALAVFAKANATERKTLRPLLQAKAERELICRVAVEQKQLQCLTSVRVHAVDSFIHQLPSLFVKGIVKRSLISYKRIFYRAEPSGEVVEVRSLSCPSCGSPKLRPAL